MDNKINLYFSDVFEVSEGALEDYGAFNVSLVTDLPLFIDPFLLFNSEKQEYQQLHDNMINYLRFLKKKSDEGSMPDPFLRSWYFFSEVKQNWLGFCKTSNTGRGLGKVFAKALDENLVYVFRNFGNEQITRGSHIEKLCLIRSGVGRDMISDFTTNLILDYLLNYTQEFAKGFINSKFKKIAAVNKAVFNYDLERWLPKKYELPFFNGDFVILTPKDILTKDDTWINQSEMYSGFEDIPNAIENETLRAQINNYFYEKIPTVRGKEPTKEQYKEAIEDTIKKYPEIVDYYIRQKEDNGDQAVVRSNAKVAESYRLYIKQFGKLSDLLLNLTHFYQIPGNTKDETKQKIEFFKDVIENKGGHHIFYQNGQPIRKETDVHILFRLTWHYTPSDISREVNDGRGPADFKISRGATDKTLVEFKLASNTQLKRNLEKQLDIYKKASDAEAGFKVIIYFSNRELLKTKRILKNLKMEDDPNIYLIDAIVDNKPSGSKA